MFQEKIKAKPKNFKSEKKSKMKRMYQSKEKEDV